MKIVLAAINSKYIHSNLAVYSLKEYAQNTEAEIKICEYTINNQQDDILSALHKEKADMLCLSVYIWNLNYVEEITREYHKINPRVHIWVGGPEVSYETQSFLDKNPQIKGVMIGEGEQTFKEVVDCYVNSFNNGSEPGEEKLSSIHGLAFTGSQGFKMTAPREPLCLDDIPFPYSSLSDFENRIIYYESSRGCPFMCSYCLSSIEKSVRFRSLDLVKKELLFFIQNKVPQVKFVDRTFNINPARTVEMLTFLRDNDNGITNFHFEVAADILTDEEIEVMSTLRPGLIQLEIGVQSTNDSTITEIHRTMNLSKVWKNVTKIQAFKNIHQHLDLIAGLPFEDYKTFKKSFNDIYALYPDQLQLGFLKVLKGSYMYEHAKEYDAVWHSKPPYEIMSTKWLSYDQIILLKNIEEILEVYYNSGQFPVSIRLLETLFDTAFDMFENFAAFYEVNELFHLSHSRNKRCEILLQFANEIITNRKDQKLLAEKFKEALTYDLYQRENCKSRPSFAKDLKSWAAVSRRFCDKGKLSHLEYFEHPLISVSDGLSKPYYILFDYENKKAPEIITDISPE